MGTIASENRSPLRTVGEAVNRTRKHLGILAVVIFGLGCSRAGTADVEPAFVAPSESTPRTVSGVAYVDVDGDGAPGSNDTALLATRIRSGTGQTRFVEGVGDTLTTETGGFVFELPAATESDPELFVEIELPDPNVNGTSGSLFYRAAVEAGTLDVSLGLRAVPNRCPVADFADCGAPLRPDLVQLISGQPPSADRPLPADSWSIDTSTRPGRTLLRFASAIANEGDGPLHVIAVNRTADGMETVQRIWSDTNSYVDQPAGTFVHHDGHDHMHLEGFETYRLLDLDGSEVATANKVSFCLTDSWSVDPDASTSLGYGVYTDELCGALEQAINVGSADYYGADLDDQWIDITGVAPGTYRVELIIDPDNIIEELDESNNVASFEVVIAAEG